ASRDVERYGAADDELSRADHRAAGDPDESVGCSRIGRSGERAGVVEVAVGALGRAGDRERAGAEDENRSAGRSHAAGVPGERVGDADGAHAKEQAAGFDRIWPVESERRAGIGAGVATDRAGAREDE